jgi:hypothetical protein
LGSRALAGVLSNGGAGLVHDGGGAESVGHASLAKPQILDGGKRSDMGYEIAKHHHSDCSFFLWY